MCDHVHGKCALFDFCDLLVTEIKKFIDHGYLELYGISLTKGKCGCIIHVLWNWSKWAGYLGQ